MVIDIIFSLKQQLFDHLLRPVREHYSSSEGPAAGQVGIQTFDLSLRSPYLTSLIFRHNITYINTNKNN